MERWRILHKESDFTIIDNGIFRDTDLSLAEVGFLCKILSLPDSWNFSTEGMAKLLKENIGTVKAIIIRLVRHGYCKKGRLYDSKTRRITGYEYTFYEVKNGLGCASVPQAKIPSVESPAVESPAVENQLQLNTNSNKVLKEESTKEKGRTFVPPTLDQVKDAFVNCNYSSDPMEFWAHYTNCGWKLSGGRGAMMKDWKLAAYNWEKREKQFNRNAR